MGILSDDFYKGLNQPAKTPALSVTPAQPSVAEPAPVQSVAPVTPQTPLVTERTNTRGDEGDILLSDNPYVDVAKRLGPLGTAGAVVGSIGGPIGALVGATIGAGVGSTIKYPTNWNDMSFAEKSWFLSKESTKSLGRMVVNLPREVVKAPVRYVVSVGQPWARMAQGKPFDRETLMSEPPVKLPWLGEVPTYFQTYDEGRKQGLGKFGSLLYSGSTALGDVTMLASLTEAGAKAMQPRAPVTTTAGTPAVQNVAPIRQQLIRDNGILKGVAKAESSAEYYTLPETTAKQFGGSKNNTFFKVTPAAPGEVEVAVVQTRGGVIPRAVDWTKSKFGIPDKTYKGDFGPEIKVQSQIVPLSDDAAKIALEVADEPKLGFIPSNVVKGMESKPITTDQLANLSKIGEMNGVNPGIRDAVVRTITGKKVMGEMTQAEYVKSAQTLGLFNQADKYIPKEPWLNPVRQYVSPQRRWMRTYEEKSGIPLYSEAYVPMEDAVRVRDLFRDVYRNKAREVFGNYAGPTKAAERQAITSYMQGNTDAIVGNPAFSAVAKNEMIDIATKLRGLYDEVGPQLDVPTDIFLKDYQPHIQNIGGIYQMYKQGAEIPKELEFFGKFKRKGNFTTPQIDDSLALFDIYVNSGSNRMFLNPALQRISALAENLPPTLKGSVKSYVLEKMGYAGRLEQALDDMVPSINKKIGLNLPPDTARKMTDLLLSTQYSGLLSSPATWFRQMFQYPLFGYSRLGPRFSMEGVRNALTKEGIDEVAKKGLFVDLGVPYGEELAKESVITGKLGTAYKKATQIPLAPNSMADNAQRAIVYHQFKLQFNDAIGKYNSGKITWPQLEKELDFPAFSPVDQNLARQKIVAGDVDGAFTHLVRDIIDETNFPYRKAASGRISYGLGGKLGTSLLQWPNEAVHTLGRWASTGQFDKLIRYAGASVAIKRTFEDAMGIDFSRSLFLGPFNNVYSPFVQTALNTINGLTSAVQGNRQAMNESFDKVANTLKSAGMPAGVAIQNVRKFWRGYDRGIEMMNQGTTPDPKKPFPVLNDKGEVRFYTDFTGLFWGELMGFPIDKKQDDADLLRDIKNAQFDRSQVKERILELYQQEKYDEASELMGQTGITITPQDMDDYYIPLTERTFKSLPANLKAQFAPRVYPEAFNNSQ